MEGKVAINNVILTQLDSAYENLLVSAPAGSGKTSTALYWWAKRQRGKLIYVAPTRALNYEARSMLEEFGVKKIAVVNKDFAFSRLRIKESEAVVTTYFSLDAVIELIPAGAFIVLDEIHHASDPNVYTPVSRLLYELTSREVRVYAASATLNETSLATLSKWLRARVVKIEGEVGAPLEIVSWRPGRMPQCLESAVGKACYSREVPRAAAIAEHLARQGRKVLVFAPERAVVDLYANVLSRRGLRVVKLHGGLPRAEIEEGHRRLKEGDFDVAVGALIISEGINAPIDDVVLDVKRGEVRAETVAQVVGRAGRPGLSQSRRVHLIWLSEDDFTEIIEVAGTVEFSPPSEYNLARVSLYIYAKKRDLAAVAEFLEYTPYAALGLYSLQDLAQRAEATWQRLAERVLDGDGRLRPHYYYGALYFLHPDEVDALFLEDPRERLVELFNELYGYMVNKEAVLKYGMLSYYVYGDPAVRNAADYVARVLELGIIVMYRVRRPDIAKRLIDVANRHETGNLVEPKCRRAVKLALRRAGTPRGEPAEYVERVKKLTKDFSKRDKECVEKFLKVLLAR